MPTLTFDEIERIAAAHHAAEAERNAPIQFRPTPKAIATVAGRRFLEALTALTPGEREVALAVVVTKAPAGPRGCGFSLLTSHDPVRDPQLA